MANIDTAQREYFSRPADERFPSLQAMVSAAQHDKNLSAERTYPLNSLHVSPVDGSTTADLQLTNGKGQSVRFTHWSFSQLARTVGAPAGYLRDGLSPGLAAAALNEGIQKIGAKPAAMLVRAANGNPVPTVRSLTSDSYSRVWDCDLYGAVVDQLVSRDARWSLPPTWGGEPAGANRGDRDSFLILTNGGSIVTDPSAGTGDGASMFRGLLIRNSEVGAASLTIQQILFRYICGNHMLWGAVVDQQYSRRHVGKNLDRDAAREISRIAFAWADQSAARDQAIVQSLISHDVATTRDGVISQLRSWGATEQQAIDAFASCEQTENASPRSFWGIAQGLTRVSQLTPYAGDRYELDRLAGLVLSRGAKLVAA